MQIPDIQTIKQQQKRKENYKIIEPEVVRADSELQPVEKHEIITFKESS